MLRHWPLSKFFPRHLLWATKSEAILSSAGVCLILWDSSYLCVLSKFLVCLVSPGLKNMYLKSSSHSLPHHQTSQEVLTMQRGSPHQHNGANIQPRANCSCVSLWRMHQLATTSLLCVCWGGRSPLWKAPGSPAAWWQINNLPTGPALGRGRIHEWLTALYLPCLWNSVPSLNPTVCFPAALNRPGQEKPWVLILCKVMREQWEWKMKVHGAALVSGS